MCVTREGRLASPTPFTPPRVPRACLVHALRPGRGGSVRPAVGGFRRHRRHPCADLGGRDRQRHRPDTPSALDASGTHRPRIVVDLSRVTFMDSTGINIFVAAHRSLTEAGGWIRLAAPTEAVLRLLQIVGVDAVIDCRETLRQALSR
ncbi:STAS domain-containing protein [Streptomyces sp. NPDC058252]|uniref:STAS domain-containing protein n=1 Tax=Streptomyces sp. NPDC058252 TaxID=3346405 RepID=UPI0036E65AAB